MMTMMGLGLIAPLLLFGGLVFAVAYALGWRPQVTQQPKQPGSGQSSQTPVEILKARYARGEITRDEYEQMRLDLESALAEPIAQ